MQIPQIGDIWCFAYKNMATYYLILDTTEESKFHFTVINLEASLLYRCICIEPKHPEWQKVA